MTERTRAEFPTGSTPDGSTPGGGTPTSESSHAATLLERLAASGPEGRAGLRAAVIAEYLPLVTYLARRFENRGEPVDDLVQVGRIGLIKAVDRYEPARGDFLAYATPLIVGEIRRYLRDAGGAVRVPRRLQEMQASTMAATSALTHELGRFPTVAEVAERLGVPESSVLEGIESSHAFVTTPLLTTLDEPSQGIDSDTGAVDPALQALERRLEVEPLLASLPRRERSILVLRFYGNLTQSEIAERLGISQMHVSRLITRALDRMRGQLGEERFPG